MSEKCKGCGIEKQDQNINELGFVKSMEHDLCVRCHEIKNFNLKPNVNLGNDDFKKIIDEVKETNKLVVWVLDIFDLEGSKLEYIQKQLSNNPMIIVVNKADLLPKSIKDKKLLDYIDRSIPDNLNIKNIILLSALKKKNIDFLIEEIIDYGKNDVYFVGATNTGKSTILNQIVKAVWKEEDPKITTSFYAGTTLDKIEIPFINDLRLIDTPGIINPGQVYNLLDKDSLKVVIPNKEIKPINFQLNDQQTIFITGLAMVSYVSGPAITLTVYASNNIEVHRSKLERAHILRSEKMSELSFLNPPTKEEYKKIEKFKEVVLTLENEKEDVVIPGLGWVTFRGYGKKEVRIIVPETVNVIKRKALI